MQIWLSTILTDMQAFHRHGQREENGRTKLRWVYECSRNFSWHSWIQPPKTWTRKSLAQITPAQLMRKAATVRNTQVTSSRARRPCELAMGRKPRGLLDPASMNPEQFTSTPTKQDLLQEEIPKLTMKTHLEVQQREDNRRNLAERMKFVPPDLQCRRTCVLLARRSEQSIQQGRKPGKWLKGETVKGPMDR